jgi:hypothetical protein
VSGRSYSSVAVTAILLPAALECHRPLEQTVRTELAPGVRVTPSIWVDSAARPMLRATATLRNSRPDSVRLTFGGCPIEVRAYRIPRGGNPVWKLSDSRPLCPAFEMVVTLAPGDSTVLRTAAPVASMKDVSPIERGRYAFTVTVRTADAKITTPEIPAGEVALP